MFLRNWTRITLTVAVACLFPAVASAKAGEGVRTGNLTLSLGATAAGAVNTNVFRQSTQEAVPVIGPSVRLVPFLKMDTVDTSMVDFGFDGKVGWEQYIAAFNTSLSKQSGLTSDVGAHVAFNNSGAVSFQIEDHLQRLNQPPPDPAPFAYGRTVNRVGATFGLHPGGKVFQHYLSWDWIVALEDRLPDLNKQTHDFTLKNYWRFLPRTAVVLSGDFKLIHYDTATRNGGVFTNVNSTPLRVTGGLTGLITKRLSLRLVGGYGWGFYSSGPTYKGLVLTAELAFAFGNLKEGNKLALGYQHSFQDSSIANYATFDKPYASYDEGFADNRVHIHLGVDAMIRKYVGAPTGTFMGPAGNVTISGGLNDLLIHGTAQLDFNAYKWWTLALAYHLSTNLTNDVITSSVPGNDVVREYVQHLITFSTTFRY